MYKLSDNKFFVSNFILPLKSAIEISFLMIVKTFDFQKGFFYWVHS